MNRINPDGQNNIASMRKAAQACAHRHLFHMMPPQGWTNDPNGFVYYSGSYHLFYQHNPYAAQFGIIHWGHAKSADLVRWEPLPVALAPDQPYDAGGCFSGSSVVHNGKLYVFYTGNDKDSIQTQCLAISEDGLHFQKYENNPVIAAPPEAVKPTQFRDPCVFRRGERFYMVVGAENKGCRGQVIVYISDDLLNWSYLNTITAGDDTLGYMWECPNLFFQDDRAVLILSPQGITGYPQFNSSHDSGYFVGHFDEATGAFTHGGFHKLDPGFDFYAPQIAANIPDRSVITAWMSTWETPAPTSAHHWAGSMILPREVRVKGDRLLFAPVREIEKYLKPVIAVGAVSGGELPPLEAAAGRLRVSAENKDFTIRLFCSADGREYTEISYSADICAINLDLSHSGEAARGTRSVTLEYAPDILDIYLDRSSVEVFINGGEYVMTARVFPHQGSSGIRILGEAVFQNVSLWGFAVHP